MKEESVTKEIENLTKIREEFYDFLDANIAKDRSNMSYDFSDNPTLDAKSVYELFYKLNYQARKLRGSLYQAYDI
jgi:hypothetical protein